LRNPANGHSPITDGDYIISLAEVTIWSITHFLCNSWDFCCTSTVHCAVFTIYQMPAILTFGWLRMCCWC